MDFFNDCKTQEEAKATFKRLCKCFHPDKGGEESLMIELKKQYDDWSPSYRTQEYQFNFIRAATTPLDFVYEKKISELNGIIYQLRNDIDLMRINRSFDKDAYNSEARKNRILQQQMEELKQKLEDKKRELTEEHERIKNMSLGEKIKKVFGYE